MRDTPRTDEAKWEDDRGREVVDAYVAESLERELAEATAQTLEAVGQLQAAQLRIAELEASFAERVRSFIQREQRIAKTTIDDLSQQIIRLGGLIDSAERDALQRAADAIQGRISAHPLGSTAMVEAHKCQSVVLALIPKERT